MAEKRTGSIVTSAVMLIRSNILYAPRLMNSWFPAETWVEALQKLGHIDASLNLRVRQFNAAFARSGLFGSVMSRFDGSNESGMFRVSFQHRHYYYLTQEKMQAMYPSPLNRAWKDRVLDSAANVLSIPCTRARPHNVDTVTVLRSSVNETDVREENEPQSSNKRQRLETAVALCSYWPSSHEAHQLFKPTSCRAYSSSGDGNNNSTETTTTESPQEALERRISELRAVNESEDSWRAIVKGGDPDNYCTKAEIFEIRQRATFLCVAYQLALKHMNQWTWHDCCRKASLPSGPPRVGPRPSRMCSLHCPEKCRLSSWFNICRIHLHRPLRVASIACRG